MQGRERVTVLLYAKERPRLV